MKKTFNKLFNNNKVISVIHNITDIVELTQTFRPTPVGFLRLGMGLTKKLMEAYQIYDDVFEYSLEWCELFNRDFTDITRKLLSSLETYTISQASSKVIISKVHTIEKGVEIGWHESATSMPCPTSIYCTIGKQEQAMEFFTKRLWAMYKNDDALVLNVNKEKITLEVDTLVDALPSELATKYAEYFTKCFVVGVNRSLLLYGPPGTGKSTIAKQLTKELKLRSLRIRLETLDMFNAEMFQTLIDAIKPGCVIVDDIDRGASDSLLETLTYLRQHVKLVVGTANNRGSLDEALLRPGRFDELGHVKSLDITVIKNVLGKYADAFEDVKAWPISFIEEYVTRRKFQSADDAKSSMVELAKRVKRLDKYDEEDDFVSVMNTSKKKPLKINKVKQIQSVDD